MKKYILVILCCVLAFSYSSAQFVNPLFIPDTMHGPTYNLEVAPSKMQFLPGDSTNTFGINGPYLGPTLIMNADDTVQMNVTNSLGEPTTMHWHGMHVAPEHDGGPHTIIADGETWMPRFKVLEEATTFWYHPHLHHHTARQVYNGAAGMIIIRDNRAVGNMLPHTYGVDEFPLIIQDKSFDTTNQLIFTALADTMMVNGTMAPYLEVPAQMVRFHILNASNQRVYNLGLPPNLSVWQIGSDGGLLARPVLMNRMQITPGERIELVIDFSGLPAPAPQPRMVSFGSELGPGLSGGPMGPRGGGGNRLDSIDFDVIEFRVVAQTANAITTPPPMNLNTFNKPLEANADRFRTKTFTVHPSGFPFYINDTVMNINYINDTVILDDIEVWTLINATDVAHPWHIHDIQFYILDINGMPPPTHLAGRKDVIITQPGDTIRYITQFDDFANDTVPYMFHCHNLFHEDGGMMGQFIVVNPTGITEQKESSQKYKIYPNPSDGLFRIKEEGESFDKIRRVEVYDIKGKKSKVSFFIQGNELNLDLSSFSTGNYLVKLIAKDNSFETLKIVKD